MATILGHLSSTFSDQYGIRGSLHALVQIDDTKTVAQLRADALAWQSAAGNLSQGVVLQTNVGIVADFNSDPSGAVGDIEKGVIFNFDNAADIYATGYLVPDLDPAILNGSGLVNLANAQVVAFVDYITTPQVALTVVTKGAVALTALRDVLLSFRKHRKPLSRKTREAS